MTERICRRIVVLTPLRRDARQVAQSTHTWLGAESEFRSSPICRSVEEHDGIPLLKARKQPISKHGWRVSVGCFRRLHSFGFHNLRKGRAFQVPPRPSLSVKSVNLQCKNSK